MRLLVEVHRFFDAFVFFGRWLLRIGGRRLWTKLTFGAQPEIQGVAFGAAGFFVIALRKGGNFDFLVEVAADGGDRGALISHG